MRYILYLFEAWLQEDRSASVIMKSATFMFWANTELWTSLIACKLTSWRFGVKTSLLTENPLSTVAWPCDNVRSSCIVSHKSWYSTCISNISGKKESNLSSPLLKEENFAVWYFLHQKTNFLYWANTVSASSAVFYLFSISICSTCWNILVAFSGFDTMSLGSMLTNFLAKLYFRGLLSCILKTVVCSITSNSFLNSKTCNWLIFFSLNALSTIAFAANPMELHDWLHVTH